MKRIPSNRDDVLDSRDIRKRIDELRDMVDNGSADADEQEEFKVLTELEDEASDSTDWRHGETLIREDYFTEYAQELAEDLGYMSRDLKWPHNHIDWEAAAEELQEDYMLVDFGGVSYWIRA